VTSPLVLVDLFSGAGGLSEGFTSGGRFTTVAAVEMDVAAAATYAANHNGGDLFVGDISAWIRADRLPEADVVVGGPPCQGFSNLGNRRVRDPRNALWRRYVEALAKIQPRCFVLENVADFLRSGQYRDLRRATGPRGPLRDYRITASVLNAAEFGVPQVRKRAVVVGVLRDLPIYEPPVGAYAGKPSEWATVHSAIGDLDLDIDPADLPETYADFNGQTLRGPFKTTELHLGRRPSATSIARYRHIPEGGNRKDIPYDLQAPCWRDHDSGSGDVMGRLRWDKPSVTIRTEFWKPEKGRYLHPQADRALTHLEAARLQGFRDDYLWHGSKMDIGRQIGNAVPVRLAAALAEHLADYLELRADALREGAFGCLMSGSRTTLADERRAP